ncbi:MAG: CAAX prenyl protease-related protein [Chamaesiphon sp.]
MHEQPEKKPPQSSSDFLNGHTLPFLVFIALSSLAGFVPGGMRVVYPLKTIVTAAILWYYRRTYLELKSSKTHWSAIPVGLAALVLWIGLDPFYPKMVVAEGFNPFTPGNALTNAFMVVFRLGGSALVVPIMEELFWRSWLLRFLLDSDDFRHVPVGQISWSAFLIMAVAFGFEHDRWLPGILTGFLYGGLVYWRKEIRSSILAHAVTNFGLGLYVLATGSWSFW